MAARDLLHLLRTRRFVPLFVTQFLDAFNDNVFKNALVILITYHAAEMINANAQMLITLAAGLYILPFFLFSATAGQLADKHEKSRMIRLVKLVEVVVLCIAAAGFYLGSVGLLILVLFLMGVQSTFFGPLKYSILPDHLKENELIGGNALIETATFIAILLGTIAGGLLILKESGAVYVSILLVSMSTLGLIASFMILPAGPAAPNLRIRWNILRETWGIIGHAREREDVFLSIIGISWFWFVGATFLAQFPTFAKDILHANEQVVTLFLMVFSIGVGLGALLCNRLLKGKVTGNFVPLGAVGMALFTATLYGLAQGVDHAGETALLDASAFLHAPLHILILLTLLLIAVAGGIYIVPLYAIMQLRSEKSHRSRVVASNNVMNALFMVLSALFTLGMLALNFSVTDVFLAMAVINLPVAWVVRKLVKDQQRKQQDRLWYELW